MKNWISKHKNILVISLIILLVLGIILGSNNGSNDISTDPDVDNPVDTDNAPDSDVTIESNSPEADSSDVEEELSKWGKKLSSLGLNTSNEEILLSTLPNITKLDITSSSNCFLAGQKIDTLYEEYYVITDNNGLITTITTTEADYNIRTTLYPISSIEYKPISIDELAEIEAEWFFSDTLTDFKNTYLYSYYEITIFGSDRITIFQTKDSLIISDITTAVCLRPEAYLNLTEIPEWSNITVQVQIISITEELIILKIDNIVSYSLWGD